MIIHEVADGYLVVEVLGRERHKICEVLNLSELDLIRCYVTFLRGPLDEEVLHAKSALTLRGDSTDALELFDEEERPNL